MQTERNLQLTAEIEALRQELQRKEDVERQLQTANDIIGKLSESKAKIQRDLETASDYLLEQTKVQEAKTYKANKTSLELLRQLKDAEIEIETLKNYIIELKQRIAVYFIQNITEVKWLIDQGDHVRQGLIDDFYHKLQNLVPSHTSPFIVTRERINVKELDQEQQQDILHYEFSIKINQIYLNNLNAQNNPTTKTQSSKSISLYSPYKQKNQQSTLQLPQLTQDLNQSSNQNSSKSGSGDKNRWIVEFIVYQVLNQQNTIKEKYELFEGCTKMLIDYKEFSQSQYCCKKNIEQFYNTRYQEQIYLFSIIIKLFK